MEFWVMAFGDVDGGEIGFQSRDDRGWKPLPHFLRNAAFLASME
jgi:hypothetical protein